jgi:hypothetical protein
MGGPVGKEGRSLGNGPTGHCVIFSTIFERRENFCGHYTSYSVMNIQSWKAFQETRLSHRF